MDVNVCDTGLRGRGVDDGDEDSLLKTEDCLNLILAISSGYGRWPIGDRPLRFLAEGAGNGAGTGTSGTSGTDGATGAT
jgi:hypothetical protein